jgi:hypothetical protein
MRGASGNTLASMLTLKSIREQVRQSLAELSMIAEKSVILMGQTGLCLDSDRYGDRSYNQQNDILITNNGCKDEIRLFLFSFCTF